MEHIEFDNPRVNTNKALPSSYDDSLSYYEEVQRFKMNLRGVIDALNALIDLEAFDNTAINNLLAQNVSDLNETITSLNTTMNNKVDTLDNAMDLKKEDISDLTNNRKLDAIGNFTGTWNGLRPQQVDVAITDLIDKHTIQLDTIAITPEQFYLPLETSDEDMIQRAIDSITKGNILLKANKTYVCNKPIKLKDGVNLVGNKNTILDFSNVVLDEQVACIYNVFTPLTLIETLGIDVLANSKVLTFNVSPSLLENDRIILHDATPYSYTAYRDYYTKGEMLKVESVLGVNVNLKEPTYDSYIASTTSVYKLSGCTLDIKDIIIKGKIGSVGIKITHGINCNFEGLKINGSDNALLQLVRCYECNIDKNSLIDTSTAIGLNYAVSIGNCQRINITNSFLSATRHGVAIGGNSENGSIVNRDINIRRCYIANVEKGNSYSADMHGNVEFTSYEDCNIIGGVTIGGNNNKVKNCKIISIINGVAVSGGEVTGINHEIANNDIIVTRTINASRSVIDCQYGVQAILGGNLRVHDNCITVNDNTGKGMYLRNVGSTVNVNISVKNNIINYNVANATNEGIRIENSNGFGMGDVEVIGNTVRKGNINIRSMNSEYIKVYDNEVIESPTLGIDINSNTTTLVTSQLIDVKNNISIKAQNVGIRVLGASQAFSIIKLDNNLSINANQMGGTGSQNTDSSLQVNKANDLIMSNNVFGDNQAVPKQTRLYAIDSITNFFERNDYTVGTVVTVNKTNVTNTL